MHFDDFSYLTSFQFRASAQNKCIQKASNFGAKIDQKSVPKLASRCRFKHIRHDAKYASQKRPKMEPKRFPREFQNRSNFVPKVSRKCLSSAWPRFGPPGTVFGGLFGSFWARFGRRLGAFCRILELFRAFLGGVWAPFAKVGRDFGFFAEI